jgi:hypothetical protein
MPPITGELSGGWEFVQAAYLVSAVLLGGYFLAVHLRYRRETRRAPRADAAGETQ